MLSVNGHINKEYQLCHLQPSMDVHMCPNIKFGLKFVHLTIFKYNPEYNTKWHHKGHPCKYTPLFWSLLHTRGRHHCFGPYYIHEEDTIVLVLITYTRKIPLFWSLLHTWERHHCFGPYYIHEEDTSVLHTRGRLFWCSKVSLKLIQK